MYGHWDTTDRYTLSNGDSTALRDSSYDIFRSIYCDARMTSGKYYYEILFTSISGYGMYTGIDQEHVSTDNSMIGLNANSWCFQTNGAIRHGGLVYDGNVGVNVFSGDVVGYAIDLDNGEWWTSVNGVWTNSGDPENRINPLHTGVTGPLYTGVATYKNPDEITLISDPLAFNYTPPVGFTKTLESTIPLELLGNFGTTGRIYFKGIDILGNFGVSGNISVASEYKSDIIQGSFGLTGGIFIKSLRDSIQGRFGVTDGIFIKSLRDSIQGRFGVTGGINLENHIKAIMSGNFGMAGNVAIDTYAIAALHGRFGLNGNIYLDRIAGYHVNGNFGITGKIEMKSALQDMALSGDFGLVGFVKFQGEDGYCNIPIYSASPGRWT